MCNHNDCAIAGHFIGALHKFSVHNIISGNSPLVFGQGLTKDHEILAFVSSAPSVRDECSHQVQSWLIYVRMNSSYKP
jgi:hypothetical protein